MNYASRLESLLSSLGVVYLMACRWRYVGLGLGGRKREEDSCVKCLSLVDAGMQMFRVCSPVLHRVSTLV